MTMAVLSNGGGVGPGKAVNGGYGLVLDGSERVDRIIRSALKWDVNCGIARRAWAGNPDALEAAMEANDQGEGHITLPNAVDGAMVERLVSRRLGERT
jgi:urocanate hydratase